jgi:hypothetical protein
MCKCHLGLQGGRPLLAGSETRKSSRMKGERGVTVRLSRQSAGRYCPPVPLSVVDVRLNVERVQLVFWELRVKCTSVFWELRVKCTSGS